jgi:hypothetical protein
MLARAVLDRRVVLGGAVVGEVITIPSPSATETVMSAVRSSGLKMSSGMRAVSSDPVAERGERRGP